MDLLRVDLGDRLLDRGVRPAASELSVRSVNASFPPLRKWGVKIIGMVE